MSHNAETPAATPAPAGFFQSLFHQPASWRVFLAIGALGTLVRVVLYVWALAFPLINENNNQISGAIYQQDMDIGFYGRTSEVLFSYRDVSETFQQFVDFYISDITEPVGIIAPGPVFPAMLQLFDYRPGNTLPLSIFFVVLSTGFLWVWLRWLYGRRLSPFWLLTFALLPHPLWYMLNVSTDMPFALLVGLFFVCYFHERWSGRRIGAWLILLTLIVLTRPNGCSFLAFCFFDMLFFQRGREGRLAILAILAGLGAIATLFYYPYLVNEISRTARLEQYVFFGLRTADYREGIFGISPTWLDSAVSTFVLGWAKLLYFVGLRPSYGDASTWLVAGRALPGLILLPGLVHLYWRGDRRLKWLVSWYLLPILLTASQDRYALPLQPILLYQCALLVMSVHGSLILRSKIGVRDLGDVRQE